MATLPDNRLQSAGDDATDVRECMRSSTPSNGRTASKTSPLCSSSARGTIAVMGGRIVASAMWWPCGETAATLGMVIVERSHRHAGIGRLIMEAVLDQIGDRTVYLNATEDGLPLYRKLGFAGIVRDRPASGRRVHGAARAARCRRAHPAVGPARQGGRDGVVRGGERLAAHRGHVGGRPPGARHRHRPRRRSDRLRHLPPLGPWLCDRAGGGAGRASGRRP